MFTCVSVSSAVVAPLFAALQPLVHVDVVAAVGLDTGGGVHRVLGQQVVAPRLQLGPEGVEAGQLAAPVHTPKVRQLARQAPGLGLHRVHQVGEPCRVPVRQHHLLLYVGNTPLYDIANVRDRRGVVWVSA